MRLPGFVGSSNEEQSYIAGQERTVNFYVADVGGGGPSQRALYPTPGVTEVSSVAVGGGRAHESYASREWAVVAGTFYEIDETGTWTSQGTVAIGDDPATISYNGDGGGELFITSGGNGYIYDIDADTLTQIAALNGIADIGDHLDGYFLALDRSTSTVYFSDLLDGTTWTTGTNFWQRSAAADGWTSLKVLNGAYIWLLGTETSEVWYNAGTFPIPFEPHPSGRGIEYGCDAAFSPAVVHGTMYWLGKTINGRGMVLATRGFTPERVSKPSVELAIQARDRTAKAVGDAYDEAGHVFYLLQIPGGTTWTYDAATQEWHERGTWVAEDNEYVPWRPRHHAYAFDQHRWLDTDTGSLWRSENNVSTDVDSRPLRRVRRTPSLVYENQRLFYSSFELLMDVGVGAASQSPFLESQVIDETTLFADASTWAAYEFQSDGTDENAAANDLTANNTPTYTPAVYQNGTQLTHVTDKSDSSYFSIASASATDFDPGTADFVWAFKVKRTNGQTHPIVDKFSSVGGGYKIWITASSNANPDRVSVTIEDSIGGTTTVSSAIGAIPVDDQFHAVVIVVDRTAETVTTYVDQVSVATGSTAGLSGNAPNSSSDDLLIGASNDDDDTLTGILDQVVYLDGATWSQAQVNTYTGLNVGSGGDPDVMLRWSDDGGKTWGAEVWRSAGEVGEYNTRVVWHRLGMARKRVWEVVVSDPVPWRLVDAFVEIAQPPRRISQAQAVNWSG